MNRLFQHYEGEVKQIQGIKLKGLKSLIYKDSKIENVILFWFKTEDKWLRIFIDGAYCGIDEYETDLSNDDIDDDVYFVNQDHWIIDLVIQNAKVTSEKLPLISLIINFTNGNKLILECDTNENCTLRIIEFSQI